VSGKIWKGEAEKRASADKNAILGSSWEKKMQAKALKKAFQEQKQAAVDAQKEKRKVGAADACCVLLLAVAAQQLQRPDSTAECMHGCACAHIASCA
jgi:hypothetical protein